MSSSTRGRGTELGINSKLGMALMRACKCVDSSLGDWFASSFGSSQAQIGCHCELGICKLSLAGVMSSLAWISVLSLHTRCELGKTLEMVNQAWGSTIPSTGTVFQAWEELARCSKLNREIPSASSACMYVLSLAHVRVGNCVRTCRAWSWYVFGLPCTC